MVSKGAKQKGRINMGMELKLPQLQQNFSTHLTQVSGRTHSSTKVVFAAHVHKLVQQHTVDIAVVALLTPHCLICVPVLDLT